MSQDNSKLVILRNVIKNYQSVVIAFSGGVDSTFLLRMCRDVLGKKNVIAVTAVSDSYTSEECSYSQHVAENIGVKHIIIKTNEMSDTNFVFNPPDRCYYCKTHLFSELLHIAKTHKIKYILDASNVDDESDYRPGRRAAKYFGVKSPLIEAGMTKEDIRQFSKALGLDSWNRAANPCLASRIPYGSEITHDKLAIIAKAEKFLKDEGLRIVRVRHHGEIARIEVSENDIQKLMDHGLRKRTLEYLKSLGFVWVALDIEGYRTGSLNEILTTRSSS